VEYQRKNVRSIWLRLVLELYFGALQRQQLMHHDPDMLQAADRMPPDQPQGFVSDAAAAK
jgi:hypothetical protein